MPMIPLPPNILNLCYAGQRKVFLAIKVSDHGKVQAVIQDILQLLQNTLFSKMIKTLPQNGK